MLAGAPCMPMFLYGWPYPSWGAEKLLGSQKETAVSHTGLQTYLAA